MAYCLPSSFFTTGGFQEPSMIEGGVSFKQQFVVGSDKTDHRSDAVGVTLERSEHRPGATVTGYLLPVKEVGANGISS
jgi:hypothetical protein